MIKVFDCGTEVKLKIGGTLGMITAFTVSFGKVRYEITYHNGGPCTCWVNEHEFTVEEPTEKQEIGFKTRSSNLITAADLEAAGKELTAIQMQLTKLADNTEFDFTRKYQEPQITWEFGDGVRIVYNKLPTK